MTLPANIHQDYHNFKKGIFFVLLAWFFFATSFAIVKEVAPFASIPSILLIRNIMGVLFVLPWMLKHYKTSFKSSNPTLIGVRASTLFISTAFTYLSVQMIPLVDASLLVSSSPLFVPFVAWLWLRSPISHKLWLPILVGFLGMALILHPDKQIFNAGAFFALGAGISSAVSLVVMRHAARQEKIHTVLFYAFLIGVLLSLPFVLLDWRVASWDVIWILGGMGVLTTMGQWAIFKSLHYGKASIMAPFGYVSVIYAGIFDWLIYSDLPSLTTLLGVLLVSAAGIFVILSTKPPRT